MSKCRLLVVDDENDILELVKYNLTKQGYDVIGVQSGEEALAEARATTPALIVLDIMLPGIGGLDCCRVLRSDPATSAIPIVMLSAKGEEADVVAGLELGADDYVTKPFSPRVLVARIRAVLRRRQATAESQDAPIDTQGLRIEPTRHEVWYSGERIELTASQFAVLGFLAKHPGWVFTRSQIINAIKGDDYPVTERSVDVQIVALRKKLGEAGALIQTVRGVGYRFKA